MVQQKVDLTGIFQTVTQELAKNQQTLDQADEYNHNHGSNMVQTFQTVTNALEKKKGSSSSAALAYAAKTLAKQANSGSSQLYAQNLAQAATKFKGKRVDEKGALDLLQTLIGAASGGSSRLAAPRRAAPAAICSAVCWVGCSAARHKASQPSHPNRPLNLRASLKTRAATCSAVCSGGMLGGESQSQSAPQPQSGDLLGSLLGGLTGSGSGSSGSQQGGIGLQNILAGAMAYMQASQGGASTMEALTQAFAAGSGMGSSRHRSESTQVVVSSFLKALSGQNR